MQFDAYCHRCKKEYHLKDNYGSYQCHTHTGPLRVNEHGLIYYECCAKKGLLDYHPTRDKSLARQFGFNFRCSNIQRPKGCTPCDHGDYTPPNGTPQGFPKTITTGNYAQLMSDKYNMNETQIGDALVKMIANGAIHDHRVLDLENTIIHRVRNIYHVEDVD